MNDILPKVNSDWTAFANIKWLLQTDNYYCGAKRYNQAIIALVSDLRRSESC